jgi:hypothetical protein
VQNITVFGGILSKTGKEGITKGNVDFKCLIVSTLISVLCS